MSDSYESVRALPFTALAAALGLDIAHYKTRKQGSEWYGPCPSHNPKHNSTSFSYSSDGKFFCFSCNIKGRGGIDLIKAVRRCGFKEAVEFLGGIKPPAAPKKPVLEVSSASSEPLKPFTGKYHQYAKPCAWLTERVPDAGITSRFGVFYYENNARKSGVNGHVLIPIKDLEGVCYGYLARNIGEVTQERPKYRWPANLPKSRFIFGGYELTEKPVKVCYLVESPFTVLKFCSFGLPALALYGWSVSQEQLLILSQVARGCVYIPDSNKRAEASHQLASIAAQMWVRFPPLPDGIDDPEQLDHQAILDLTK